MAYDALLDCDGKWEKIIFYAILNPSDSSTVGSMAGALFGAYYGFGDVPIKMYDYIEEGDQLVKLGKDMYKKFYKPN
jgi:ADP-ribosylglycohydrolase